MNRAYSSRPCGVSSAPKRSSPGLRLSTSWVSRPCSKPRQASPATAIRGRVGGRRGALVVERPSGVITGRLRPRGKALRRSPEEPAHKLIEAARLMRLEEDPPAPYLFVSDETAAKAARLTDGAAPIL